MTPAARASAAIVVLNQWLAGQSAERALTAWGRASRYAGSGDRAAVRDIVYDCLRQRRSLAALGGAETGRGLVLGWARAAGAPALFDGSPHGPPAPGPEEAGRPPQGAEALDLPDWLVPLFHAALGDQAPAVAMALRHRAPVFLRVNASLGSREDAVRALASEGITAVFTQDLSFGLEVTDGARKIQGSRAYADGLVELQDSHSQAVVEALPLRDGMRVLDLCAGGGGKTLAMAARARLQLFAHDAAPRRMADLPARADRAGARIRITETPENAGPFDLILTDVPCSGSGSWRRDPEGKWRLDPEGLARLTALQAQIMDRAQVMVGAGGWLAYATCSLLRDENEAAVDGFLARTPGWQVEFQRRFSPLQGGDGFFLALLRRV